MASRWLRKWRYPLAVLIAGSSVLGGVAVLTVTPSNRSTLSLPPGGPPPPDVVVTGFDLIISYWTSQTNDTSYLAGPDCDGCPLNLVPGSTWTLRFNLTNRDSTRNHTISNISIDPSFLLGGENPGAPFGLPAGQTVVWTLSLTTPSGPGYYRLSGTIGTT